MKLLLAISGGRDSVALLDALAKHRLGTFDTSAERTIQNLQLTLAHFNHGTPHGRTAEQFVRMLAKKYDLPLYIGRTKKKLTSEADFRAARYHFFRTLKKKLRADRIVTAATADDQAETVMLNLVRGTGLAGIAAMQVDDGELLRPFLHVIRATINAYIEQYTLQYLDDPTNSDVRFTRNFLRHDVMPKLQQLNPKLVAALARTATLAREAEETLVVFANAWLDTHIEQKTLPLAALREFPIGTQKILLRTIYTRMIGNTTALEAVHLDEVLNMLAGERGGKQKTCGQLVFSTTRVNDTRVLSWKKVGKLLRSKKNT